MWSAPSSLVTGYRLEAGTAPGLSNAANTVIGPTTSFFTSGVPAGTYYVRVRAIDATGESAPSNEAVVVVGGGGCAAAPAAPTALPAIVIGSTVTLSWTPPAVGCAPTQYSVHAGSAPGLANLAVVNAGGALAFSATAPSGTYYVRVVAQNAFGISAPSNEIAFNIGSTPPPAPPAPSVLETVHSGQISGGSAPCATALGSQPCAIVQFAATRDGNMEAVLRWGNENTDLDLDLYRGSTRLATSGAVIGTEERISSVVQAGQTYQLRIYYWRGSTIENFTLTLRRPN
jgi:predicted phage tail protein